MPLLLPLFVHWRLLLPPFLSLPSTRSVLVLPFFPLLLLFLSFRLFSLLLLLPYTCPPSFLFISSIFFIHILHPLPPSLPSSSTEGSFLNMGATEAKLGRTSETNLTRHLVVYLSILSGLSLLRQFTFCIGSFEPLFVRCNNFHINKNCRYFISHVLSLCFYKFTSAARHNNIALESMTTKAKILANKKMSP